MFITSDAHNRAIYIENEDVNLEEDDQEAALNSVSLPTSILERLYQPKYAIEEVFRL